MDIAKVLIETLKKISNIFMRNNFDFCIAGGWAVSIWGTPRATEDIDLLLMIKEEQKSIIPCNFYYVNILRN